MLVRNRMSQPVVAIRPDDDFQRGLAVMQAKKLRRLPVVDGGRLVGIVAERDLLLAALHYLQSRVDIAEIMTREVVTVPPETPLRDAARLMLKNRVGGMPVVEDGRVVGMITESDIFRRFAELPDA